MATFFKTSATASKKKAPTDNARWKAGHETLRATDTDPQPFTQPYAKRPAENLPGPATPQAGPPSVPVQPVSTATVGTGPSGPQIISEPALQPTPATGDPVAQPMVPAGPEPKYMPPQPPITSPTQPAAPAPAAAPAYRPSPQAPARPPSQTGQRVNDLYAYGQQAMANPSRYDSSLMQANAKVIEDAIARMRQTGQRNIGEQFASRGLTGSSLEGFATADMESELGRYANERATGLMTDAAKTYAGDRSSAFGMGASAAGLGEQSEGRAGDEAYRAWQGEQGVYNQGRTQDQNELSLLASLADRFGPDVMDRLGYGGEGGAGASGAGGAGSGFFQGAAPGSSGQKPPYMDQAEWDALPQNEKNKYYDSGAPPSFDVQAEQDKFNAANAGGAIAPAPGSAQWAAEGWGYDIDGNPKKGVAGSRSDYGAPR